MSKFVFSLFAIVMVILPKLSDSAVAIYPKEEKPPEFACQEGCYIGDLNRVIAYNDTFYNLGKECSSYQCQTNDETIRYTCGVIAPPPECKLVEGDLNKKYPDCCQSVECPPPNGPVCDLPVEKPPTE